MANNDGPFNTIESTQEFLSILSNKIDEVLDEARRELSACTVREQRERVQAWQLVLYTIKKLSSHVANSRKLMNDLDTLRSLLDQNIPAEDSGSLQLAGQPSVVFRRAPMPRNRRAEA